jgi:alkylhydroperoxidase family enzyme
VHEPRDERVVAAFARKEQETGRVPDIYRVLANHPPALQGWVDFAFPMRYEASTPRALRELLILRVAHLRRAAHEWTAHSGFALDAGVPQAKIDAIADWRVSPHFDATEQACLALTDAMTTSTSVPDATYDAVAERFTSAQLVELVVTIGFYQCVSAVLAVFDPPGDGDQPIVAAT